MNFVTFSQFLSHQINYIFTMRKVQGLPAPGNFPKQIQCCRRSCIIKSFQNVIGYERGRCATGNKLIISFELLSDLQLP
jgi:hypothetical protein